jgi:hypothetical protein
MATIAEIASRTRAVASKRSIRRTSPGPTGALNLQKNRCRKDGNNKEDKPRARKDATDIIGIGSEEQAKVAGRQLTTHSSEKQQLKSLHSSLQLAARGVNVAAARTANISRHARATQDFLKALRVF